MVTWVERNLVARQHNRFYFPLKHVIKQALLQVEVLKDQTTSPRKQLVVVYFVESLSRILSQYHDLIDNRGGV